MKIDAAIEAVERSEVELGKELLQVGQRHAADQDVFHGSHDRARTCAEHLDHLRPLAERYGAGVETFDPTESGSLLVSVHEKASELVGSTEIAGAPLLADLRHTYLLAARAEIDWTILRQAAMAARHPDLLHVVDRCHEEVEMCTKWLRTMIKTGAPQVLLSG